MDGDLEDVFPVAQLALIESGGNGRAVLAQENAQSAAAGGNDAEGSFVPDCAARVVCARDAVFDALKGIERGIITMLIGDGTNHEVVDLFVGQWSLIGRGGLSERRAIAGGGGIREGKTERDAGGCCESELGAAVHSMCLYTFGIPADGCRLLRIVVMSRWYGASW